MSKPTAATTPVKKSSAKKSGAAVKSARTKKAPAARQPTASPAFRYVTYVAARPARIWEALTSPERTQRYWFGRTVESTWRTGESISYFMPDGTLEVRGELLACKPPFTLAFTWHVERDEEMREEPPSRVTFEIEQDGNASKLVLKHEGFPPGSAVHPMIVEGWPMILSSMKSLLETGSPLPL